MSGKLNYLGGFLTNIGDLTAVIVKTVSVWGALDYKSLNGMGQVDNDNTHTTWGYPFTEP